VLRERDLTAPPTWPVTPPSQSAPASNETNPVGLTQICDPKSFVAVSLHWLIVTGALDGVVIAFQ
jgi:hypothetical protein